MKGAILVGALLIAAVATLATLYVGTQDRLDRVQRRLASLESEVDAARASGASTQTALERTERKLHRARRTAAQFRTPFLGGPERTRNGRGAFPYCPDIMGALPVTSLDSQAERMALRFERAVHRGDIFALAHLVDPTVRVLHPGSWASTGGVRPFRVNAFPGWGAGMGIVRYGCGDQVAKHTVSVVVFDSGKSASGAAVTYYLLRRPSGWKIWGSY